jgi:regulator of protease activity HflC (stomatin/prohibitin superfamily)
LFFTFIILILAVIGLVALIGAVVSKNSEVKAGAAAVAVIAILLSGFIGFLTSITTVEAKQVGVVTTFGKPGEQTLGSGFHFKAPWQKVTEIDATIQTDEYKGDDCITVILADKNTACVSAANRWSVNKDNANDVYADFRSDNPTESLRDAVVTTQFKAAVNSVFGGYDASQEGTADYNDLAAQVQDVVVSKTNGLVDIESVTISYIKLGEKAQAKIDALQSQVAATRIAKEKKATAEEEAAANRIISDSISNDPNVLVSKCLDLISEGAFTPPAGFSCWPGGAGAIVVPSK